MKLYVCWGTFGIPWPRKDHGWHPSQHACKRAHDALEAAGHKPKVIRTYGLKSLPDFTRGRRYVKRLTGDSLVPVLVFDDGTFITTSDEIIAWAESHPARG